MFLLMQSKALCQTYVPADAEEGQATVAAKRAADAGGVQLDSAGADRDSVKVSTGGAGAEEPATAAVTAGTVSCQRWTPAGCSLVPGEVSAPHHVVVSSHPQASC